MECEYIYCGWNRISRRPSSRHQGGWRAAYGKPQTLVRLNTGEIRIVDFSPFLEKPVFAPLRDETLFRDVYIDYGVTVWMDGDIDIAPETLYEQGIAADFSA